ncbi:alpha/beta hydrolase-fold protein [Altererythrobacter sp. KTW20L]|uniref:alpha/beta hydrolase n=1 Tax=Altererythrobacter sp. KTW20L TaxID=2942210 RepID=UPI0020BECF45|nr:alpha/beta hydrolase-fold protein [Altererythrobacter sp. KTW20L]MCL6250764.1 alpha/beta hydrolase-fold protein [Altererythrobacter sp. KTW20L]
MNIRHLALAGASASVMALSALAVPAFAQQTPSAASETCLPQGNFALPAYTSVEQLADGRVTFRLCAPAAQVVKLISNDIAQIPLGPNGGLPMERDATGLWQVTTPEPIPADNYRYNFQVNGAKVPDPLATTFSRERAGVNSTVDLAGPEGDFQRWHADVPHGTVTQVTYWSEPLGAMREANVYTPPGYMNGRESYPVLYLVHGAGDSSDSWTQVGHAQNILDNLIAAGRAQPMIVVMPFGHTPDCPGSNILANTDFGEDLHGALIPHIDATFRTLDDSDSRAMAGLSMGGSHTIRFGLPRPDRFSHIGIFSMGLGMGPDDVANYSAADGDMLRRSAAELDLVYYAMGTDDFLYGTVAPTRAMLDEYGVDHVYNETGGGHTWINWRRYLADFLPLLFTD